MANETAPKTDKKKRAPQPPKPFYLVYDLTDDEKDPINVHCFSRKTDDIISALDTNSGAKVKKLEAPKGR